MKRIVFSILLVFSMALFMVLGIFALADFGDRAEALETENVQDKIPADTGQGTPNTIATATELPADKKAISPPPENSPVQQNKDVPSNKPADKQVSMSPVIEAKPASDAKSPVDSSSNSNETAIKAIEKNVNLFTERIRGRFSIWLERSAKYIEIMKEILVDKELPEELVFLPIIESGFNLNAYSRAKAVGPWQFISSTAKRYGLIIDWWRDERKDPVKSTKAAAEYLKDLYKMFGSWNLALAAYNAGEGKISRALKKTDSGDYWALLKTRQIRNETKEYVPRYIAATMIANTPEEYGFNNLDYHEPLEYDETTVNSPMDIDIIAKCAETTVSEIKELNPELRRWSTPLNVPQYTVKIPSGSKEIFDKNLSAIPKEEYFTLDKYTAKKGDTIKKIAKKTGIPVNAILALNSLSGIEQINAGSEIKIPPKEKFFLDPDDHALAKKVSYKKKSSDKGGRKNKGKKGARKPHRVKSKDKTKTRKA